MDVSNLTRNLVFVARDVRVLSDGLLVNRALLGCMFLHGILGGLFRGMEEPVGGAKPAG